MTGSELNYYSTLDEALDAAREEYFASHPDLDEDDVEIQQLNIQKYILQDGEEMWVACFFDDENEADEQGDYIPVLYGPAAQAVFNGDFDETELRQEWVDENTLHEWDEGEFQYESPVDDDEEGSEAMDEWDERE